MDKEETQQNEIKQNALSDIEIFTTRLWEHPLLNEETRKHRSEGLIKFRSFLIENRLDPDKFFSIPIGSTLWVTNDQSDWDMHVVARTIEDMNIFNEVKKKYDKANKNKPKLEMSCYSLQKIMNGSFEPVLPLLLTPDNYIGGNSSFAQELRKFVTQSIDNNANSGNTWYKERLNIIFNDYYKGWPSNLDFMGNKDTFTRLERAGKVLGERASQSLMGSNKYVNEFNKSLNKFTLPDIATYRDGLNFSNGKLSIKNNYVALGIKPHPKNM